MRPVIRLHLFLLLLLVKAKQDQYGTGRNEEHMRLSQRIERPVVQNHAGHDIHGARLLQTLLDIALCHLIVRGVLRMPEGRQIGDTLQQQSDQKATEGYREYLVKSLENAQLRILFQIINLLSAPLPDFLPVRCFFLSFTVDILLLHLHLVQVGILCPVQPLPEPEGKRFLILFF